MTIIINGHRREAQRSAELSRKTQECIARHSNSLEKRQHLAWHVRQRANERGWVTQEKERAVIDWLIRYRPHCIGSSRLEDESIQTALSECDTLALWGKRRLN